MTRKSHRRSVLRRRRRSRAVAFRILATPVTTDLQVERYNKAAHWLNRRVAKLNSLSDVDHPNVRYPRGGHPVIDGQIECPKCHQPVLTYSDPQEWQRNDAGGWQVTGYWGGTAQCCNVLLAFQPDGRAEAYDISP